MSVTYTYTSGLDHTLRQLVEFNNVAFQGYLKDMTLSPEVFELFLVPQHVVHGLSVYMHTSDGEFVGLSRTGLRGTRAWVAGVAVVPEFRGKGTGKKLMAEYLRVLKESGRVKTVTLEVLKENPIAKRLYESLGFKETSTVHKLQFDGKMDATDSDGTLNITKGVDITLPWLQHEIDYMWSREWCCVSIKDNAQTVRYVNKDGEIVTSVIVYHDESKNTLSVLACAFSKNTSAKDLQTIFAHYCDQKAVTRIIVPYEPVDSPAMSLFEEIGFFEDDMEYIMQLEL
ncbi:hypothetical protein INT43_007875 [Umbelopsis isabellina]|uniref:N-acetyltransferase domain-containing protein n=1 Tax=Mortierella isabellina TaxID=91625 RepID=A0A8H7UER7_MORIS|nr:hypothetical protein INT43_007875 [Umbelopsis isabellina]